MKSIPAWLLAAAALGLAGYSFQYHSASLDELREGQRVLADQVRTLRDAQSGRTEVAPSDPIDTVTSSEPEGMVRSLAVAREDEGSEEFPASGTAEAREILIERFDRLAGDARAKALEDLAVFARWGDEEARERIVGSLVAPDPRVREEAVKTVGELGDPSLARELRPLLDDPHPEVRKEVADALEETGSPDAGPMLLTLLDDENPEVVEDAIESLGRMGYRDAAAPIAELIESDHLGVVTAAGISLRSFGEDSSADEALARAAVGYDDADPGQRKAALKRIRKIGGEAARPFFEQGLEDESYEVRKQANKGLARLPR